MSQLGDVLTELRRDKGLTQRQLAEKFNISGATISSYETGAHQPTIDVLVQYARTFDVTADYLLGLSRIPDRRSSLSAEFINGKTVEQLISDIDRLFPEQKQALALIIENMRFYAEVTNKAELRKEK